MGASNADSVFRVSISRTSSESLAQSRLTSPRGLIIPRLDLIGRVPPSKTLKPTLALQK
jgi:hypothetical protein